jgi:hypothetical protein
MADYRLHAQIISRADGKSAVKAAAYRAAEKILNERTGNLEDFTRKRGVLYTEILTPQNAAVWMQERARLWNAVEHREDKSTRRSTAQLARELQLSLPHELTHEQRIELVRDFIKKEFVEHGIVADVAIHAPPRRGDERNHHAHILLTLRDIGPDGFGKKARLWEQQEGTGKRKSWKQFETERLAEWRRLWAVYENRALARYGHAERVDHRSLKDQGIDREPTTHIGPDANEMEQRGITTDRGDQNRRVKSANDNMAALKKELSGIEERLAELKRQLAAERIEQIQKTVRAADAVWEQAEQRHAPVPQAAVAPLQPPGPPSYPGDSAPPVSGGGKAASMPDNLSEQQDLAAKQEAARQEQAQKDEQVRQHQAAADQDKATAAAQQQETQRQAQAALDAAQQQETQRQTQATLDAAQHQEAQRQAQARQDEETRLQQLRDAENRRVEDITRQNAERLAAQSEDMRQAQQRLDAQKAEQARLDAAYRAELEKIALEDRRKQESERQAKLEEKAKEGPINDAGARYGQALGQHYDIRSPYASLAKAAMAEYAAFRRDREALDQRIAKTADPQERQALDLRKRIEGAEYLAMTSDRIAQQSWVITGRRDSQEAVKERLRATEYRIQAQDLRQQLREVRQGNAPDKDRERERNETQPEPARMRGPGSRTPDKVDELIRQQDEIAKTKQREQEKAPDPGPEPASPRRSGTRPPDKYDELVRQQDEIAKAREREREKDPDRQKQQERERELQRERDRER